MSTPVVAARPDADLADLARMMLSAHLTRIPILDDANRLVGLVSRRDLVRLLTRPDDDITIDVHRVLTDWYPGRPPTITVIDGEVTITDDQTHSVPDLVTALIRAVPGVIAVHRTARPVPGTPRP
jgi:CBS domain-containing protein